MIFRFRRRRWSLASATVGVITVLTALLAGGGPAEAGAGWTWDAATHPAGSAEVGGGDSGAGVWLYHGMYYIPGVGHMDQPLGQWKTEQAPTGTGSLGYVSHTTYSGGLQNPDLGLIATGTAALQPTIRLSDGWQTASIASVSHGNDLPAGRPLCQSGVSTYTQAAGGYQCGTLQQSCTRTQSLCYLTNPNGMGYGGDSGGPVWDYTTGGAELIGWVSISSGQQAANGEWTGLGFVPVWTLQTYSWTAAQTWQGSSGIAPFPSGNDGTGCFVTINGCVAA